MIVLLIDERPEEVTDMQRSIKGRRHLFHFDEQPEHHVRVGGNGAGSRSAMVEHRKDVVILLDSITRLARAYNMVVRLREDTFRRYRSGLFTNRRNFRSGEKAGGGSITILATALIETGSRMDDVISRNSKAPAIWSSISIKTIGKANFSAINLNKSGNPEEDLLLSGEELGSDLESAPGHVESGEFRTLPNLLSTIWLIRKAMQFHKYSEQDKIVFG